MVPTTRVTMDQHRMRLHGQSSNQVWRGEIMATNGHELPFHSEKSSFLIFLWWILSGCLIFGLFLGGGPCHHDKSLSHNLHANIDSWNLGAVLLARLDFTHSQLSGSCGRVSGFGANGSQVGGAIFVAAYIEPVYLNLICSRNVCLILKNSIGPCILQTPCRRR